MNGREPRTSTSNTKSIHGTKKKSRYTCLTFAAGFRFLIRLKGGWGGKFLKCVKNVSLLVISKDANRAERPLCRIPLIQNSFSPCYIMTYKVNIVIFTSTIPNNRSLSVKGKQDGKHEE